MKNKTSEHKNIKPAYFIAAILMIATAIVVPMQKQITNLFVSAADSKTYYMGDVDYNGKVEPSDARTVLRAAVRLVTLTGQDEDRVYPVESGQPNQAQVADIDNDLKLTSSDARAVLRMAVGIDPLKEVDNYGTVEESIPYDDNLSFAPTAVDYYSLYHDDPYRCILCGKRCGVIYISDDKNLPDQYIGWELYGGCIWSLEDRECLFCGEYVPKATCHTCKTLKPEYQKLVESEEFKQKVKEKIEWLDSPTRDQIPSTTEPEYTTNWDEPVSSIWDMTIHIPDGFLDDFVM